MKLFRIKIIVLTLLLLAALTALAQVLGDINYLFTQIVLSSAIAVLVLSLFRVVSATNRQVARLVFALQHEDSSAHFDEGNQHNPFHGLHKQFNALLNKYSESQHALTEDKQLQLAIIDRLPVGVLAIDDAEEILLMNTAARDTLNIPAVKNLALLDQNHATVVTALRNLEAERDTEFTLHDDTKLHLRSFQLKKKKTIKVVLIMQLQDWEASTEMDAWLKLIRVLTHEIMNSVSSISSLATTTNELVAEQDVSDDVRSALQRIEQRSNGMLKFVDSYRKVTSVPQPQKEWINLHKLVTHQAQLMQGQLSGIDVKTTGDDALNIHADQAQIEQVIMNVLLNAKAALQNREQKSVHIEISKKGNSPIVLISDTGTGISPEQQRQIFVPFFSTRQEGSGIGLSLCRQIMRNNGGTISLRESSDEGSCFELRFS